MQMRACASRAEVTKRTRLRRWRHDTMQTVENWRAPVALLYRAPGFLDHTPMPDVFCWLCCFAASTGLSRVRHRPVPTPRKNDDRQGRGKRRSRSGSPAPIDAKRSRRLTPQWTGWVEQDLAIEEAAADTLKSHARRARPGFYIVALADAGARRTYHAGRDPCLARAAECCRSSTSMALSVVPQEVFDDRAGHLVEKWRSLSACWRSRPRARRRDPTAVILFGRCKRIVLSRPARWPSAEALAGVSLSIMLAGTPRHDIA